MADTLTLQPTPIHDTSASASNMDDSRSTVESGYASGTSSSRSSSPSKQASVPVISLTSSHLEHLNAQLEKMHPIDILRFSRTFFPNLYQSTAFGLTGLVTLDMLSKLHAADLTATSSSQQPQPPKAVPLIFLDTLYHFPETYELVERVRAKYPAHELHTFRPQGTSTSDEFEARHGDRLYVTDSELYDYKAKVEPLHRAYSELGVAAVLTGRRRTQGGARGAIPVVEVDEERNVIKINPLATWTFADVKRYVDENGVPYNELLDRGYKSVGDWHSTSPVAEGDDERAGRWKGQAKTECGIHNKKSRYALYLEEKKRQRALAEATAAANEEAGAVGA